ncbi:alternative ribosome rescue aminoacyl-tRNA hydrolase ArfB, partial [Dermatophilus congolensis]
NPWATPDTHTPAAPEKPGTEDDMPHIDHPLPITRTLTIPPKELRERFNRATGPGGQHVNTSDTRVELSFNLTNSPSIPEHLKQRIHDRLAHRLNNGTLTITAADERSQLANRKIARQRLAQLLREAAAPPTPQRKKTRPTHNSVQRRLTSKKHRAAIKRNRSRPFD